MLSREIVLVFLCVTATEGYAMGRANPDSGEANKAARKRAVCCPVLEPRDLAPRNLEGLVSLILRDPGNEHWKNEVRKLVNDNIRAYGRPQYGESYSSWIPVHCQPLMFNESTKQFCQEVLSAFSRGQLMDITEA
jgi:hypothetical protein